MITIAVLLIIAVAIIGLIALYSRHQNARTQRVIAVGRELGMFPVDEISLQFGTDLFSQGSHRDFHKPALEGTLNGRRTFVFDYSITSGTDDNAVTIFHTVAAFAVPEQNLPSFALGRRSFLGRGIKIEGHPDFAKRFRVSGKDRAAICSLFTPDLVRFLTSTELDKQKTALEGAGNWLVFYRRTLPPEKYRTFLEQTSQIAAGFASAVSQSCAGEFQARAAESSFLTLEARC